MYHSGIMRYYHHLLKKPNSLPSVRLQAKGICFQWLTRLFDFKMFMIVVSLSSSCMQIRREIQIQLKC